ncbi:MAG: hypothetical protein P8J87_18805 [Verrucomicrobiales bacterium]|nr:hypothetical protein [Verrucomicrobiales bacterium]
MSPFIWLFVKFWIIWIAATGIGFLLGYVFGGRRAAAKIEQLQADLTSAAAAAKKDRNTAAKLEKTNAKLEKNLNDSRKRSVPREEHDAAKTRASEAEAEIRKLTSDVSDAQNQIESIRNNTVPTTKFGEANKTIAAKNREIEQLKTDVANVQRQLDAGPKQVVVNDLVGFSREESRTLDLTKAELNDLKKTAGAAQGIFDADLATAEAATNEAKDTAAKLKTERDDLRKTLSRLQVDEAAAAEAHLLRERVERRDTDIAQLRKQLDATIDELGNLKASNAGDKA